MFLASVTAAEQAAFAPQLNSEHSEYRWWPVAELADAGTQPALHPVVDLLMQVCTQGWLAILKPYSLDQPGAIQLQMLGSGC